jgi:acylphosphatase
MSDLSAATLLISGRVQGVWYRGWTREKAIELGLAGWVRNCPGGQVEAFVEGPKHLVESMIQWCRQGPPPAIVRSVDVTWSEARNLEGFHIRY